MKNYLEKVLSGADLTVTEMEEAAQFMFNPATPESIVGGFLTALKYKGESVSEITGLVNVIRQRAIPMAPMITDVMDNCGTGGDHSQSFNISTTSAFVLAGAGIKVAKHGNRSISSQTGSADVLESLGVELSATPEQMSELIKVNGIAFLYAPHVHPDMKQVMKIRRSLGIPTIFNLIGPLTNPVQLSTQFLGIYRRDLLEQMAGALHQQGRRRALVINGAGYMDEASLAGENHCVLLNEGNLTPFTITPTEVDLPLVGNEQIKGGSAKENARILKSVLNGEAGPHREVVLLNAGLGIFANGTAKTVREGIELARESIDSGEALRRLDGLIHYSKKIKQEIEK
ncbi:anthranilate phosphoribosyltransferase [Amphibacillus sp. MSJ-3]|uniref:anthranilate phosphoribosyltransferase n=1 Tax=Amphibacillus sp. MSJ-3 TaxID=2841505 RepID=UPI001C0F210D|nr:anthranilate phosphoribosyltransferase [Amphibacillus sp. MSJ-3]MBU5595693.1 anthranilate phosphoribosyltransferase [Amphibacillus sp. MSJ-3]